MDDPCCHLKASNCIFFQFRITAGNPRTEQHAEPRMPPFPAPPMAVFTAMTKGEESPLLNAELSAQIESIIQSFVAEATVQNYAVSVVREGQTAFTSGLVKTPFFIDNSISKNLISDSIATRLGVRAGDFSLDDPVEKFLPNFHMFAPHSPPDITLRQLMENAPGASQENCQGNVQANHEDDRTFLVDGAIEEWRSKVLERRAEWMEIGHSSPELHHERSPFPAMEFAILSQALAKVSAKASVPPKFWQNLVEEELLKRVEMSDTGTDLGARDFPEAGTAFDIKAMESAGQWHSTATDLAKFLVRTLSFDRSIKWEPSVREWTVNWAIQEDQGGGVGLTWEKEEMNFSGRNEHVITNGGAVTDYFGSFIGLHPRTKLGVCVLFLASKSKSTVPAALANTLGSRILRTLIPPLSKTVDSHFSGSYVCQPAAPIVRDFNDRSNVRHSDTVEVLGGEVTVTSSPSLGLQASLSISLMVSGEQQHRRGEFLLSKTPGKASNTKWRLLKISDPPANYRERSSIDHPKADHLRGITFQFEQRDEAVPEKVHEPTPGVVYCRRQVLDKSGLQKSQNDIDVA